MNFVIFVGTFVVSFTTLPKLAAVMLACECLRHTLVLLQITPTLS